MALDAYRQQVDIIPLEDWGKACTAFESISGIPSPLKPGEDVLSHFMYHGDPFEVYRKLQQRFLPSTN